ncbi:MAG TPA: LamG-like jellyroll fold domain-containing protein [Capsulimonadaceae bacterium]|jgi:hypothetical protein
MPSPNLNSDTVTNLNPVAFWDFQNSALLSAGRLPALLREVNGPLERAHDGVFGPVSLRFDADGFLARGHLAATADEAPQLNIGGPDAAVTIVAWVKRERSAYGGCQFVGGVWNEHGGRQYGLFLNIGIWGSREQICAHISSHGGATPGYPYCMDAAVSATPVSFDEWHCVAISYGDGEARAYLDGVLDRRESSNGYGCNPFIYAGGLHKGTADFTVGAVARPATVVSDGQGGFREEGALIANPFVGLLGGLAVFDRVLSEGEIDLLGTIRNT